MKSVEVNSIWKYRKRAGMGQKRVAHLLNHPDNSLFSKWERGEVVPNLRNLFKLACIFRVPVETLYPDVYRECGDEVDEREKSLLQGRPKVEHSLFV